MKVARKKRREKKSRAIERRGHQRTFHKYVWWFGESLKLRIRSLEKAVRCLPWLWAPGKAFSWKVWPGPTWRWSWEGCPGPDSWALGGGAGQQSVVPESQGKPPAQGPGASAGRGQRGTSLGSLMSQLKTGVFNSGEGFATSEVKWSRSVMSNSLWPHGL